MSRPIFDLPKRRGVLGISDYIHDSTLIQTTAVAVEILITGQASRFPHRDGTALEAVFVAVDLVCVAACIMSRKWVAIVLSIGFLVGTLVAT